MTNKFNVGSASMEQRLDYVEEILSNMKTQQQDAQRTGVLLAGDPGVGKTSFVKSFALLAGMELITIEAPHITEEHIINIPFIVFNPIKDTEKKEIEHLDDSNDYDITLADSNLFSTIQKKQPISDQELCAGIYNGAQDTIKIWEELGGTKDKLPAELAEVRKRYQVILFLDEYYRNSSMRIRNMLRGILNGKIGHHDIPEKCYVMFASNMKDEGIGDIPANNDFHRIEFSNPNKDDWFEWLVGKYKSDKHKPELKDEVIQKFHKLLDDESLNNNDVNADVRTSPRRWEQLLHYINASIPPKDEKDAKGLMTNVKLNFKNYLTGDHAELAHSVMNAVAELIKETSDINVGVGDTHQATEWRSTLAHQIEQKKKLGKTRSYIPIISGEPGIGKTTEVMKVAAETNLRYIYIDCSTLDPEDVSGIPLSKRDKSGKISVGFSDEKLYKQIMHDCKVADEHYLTTEKGKAEGRAAYEKQHWKYLIFFDELNRTSTKVFNGIRRVLLEKNFGDDHALPEGSVLVAAINPHDKGAIELTKHMQDVVDVIDAKGDWKKTREYLENKVKVNVPEPVQKTCLNMVLAFADKFKSNSNEYDDSQKEFHLEVGGSDVYISPREYTALYSQLCEKFNMKLKRYMSKLDADNASDDETAEVEKKLRSAAYDSFANILRMVLEKHSVDSPEFLHDLKNWFLHSDKIEFGEGIFFKKANKMASFDDIAEPYFEHNESKHLSDSSAFMNYMKNVNPVDLVKDLSGFLDKKLEEKVDVVEHATNKKHKKRVFSNEDQEEKFVDDTATTLENFFRNMLHAVHQLKLSNEQVDLLKKSFKKSLNSLMNKHDDDSDLNQKLIDDCLFKVLEYINEEYKTLKHK
jgi:MoxR-like ATPase